MNDIPTLLEKRHSEPIRPRALSDAIEKTASLISSRENGTSKRAVCCKVRDYRTTLRTKPLFLLFRIRLLKELDDLFFDFKRALTAITIGI